VDTVVNIGKVLGEDWNYVENELTAIHNACRAYGAALKVIFETDFITRDEPKIRLCEIVSRLGIAFVKTSTGYGFVKRKDGAYGYTGATEHDLRLMRRHCSPQVQIKAAGGIRTLDRLLQCLAWGASRIGASATESIMEEAKRRFGVPRVGGPD
jgi:deoxyribose-phosphate aldolase